MHNACKGVPVHWENKANKLLYGMEDGYLIYQLCNTSAATELLFMDLSQLKKKGESVKVDNYHLCYADIPLSPVFPEDIFVKFNISRPEDFKGHSLSVSDVIVIKEQGKFTAYFVDSIGFEEIVFESVPTCAAYSIANRYLAIQVCDDGYDYSIFDRHFRLLDGGVYDDPTLSIIEVAKILISDFTASTTSPKVRGAVTCDAVPETVDYDMLMDHVEDAETMTLEEKATCLAHRIVLSELYDPYEYAGCVSDREGHVREIASCILNQDITCLTKFLNNVVEEESEDKSTILQAQELLWLITSFKEE